MRVALAALLLAACQPGPPREVPRPATELERDLPAGVLHLLPTRGGERTSASAWSVEHQLLLTAERQPTAVRLWDRSMLLRASFPGTFAPGSQPWRPDALQIAVLVEVGMQRPEVSVRILDVRSGEAVNSWIPRDWQYRDGTALSWSATGAMLLVQGGAPSSLVLDAADGRTLAAFAAAHSRWCPDSKPLLASLAEDRVTVRDLREDLVFEASARAFAWEPGCERLALLRADGKLELWTPGTEGAPTVLGDHDDASEVLFSPVGGTIATVGGDVRLWGPSPGESRGRLAAVPVFERSLARFDREGARFGAYDDSGLGIWQVDVARRIASLALAPDERGPFEIVGDEVFLMRAGHLLRWQVQSGEQQRVARSSTSAPVTGLWWSADDSKLALVRADGVTRVIDLASASALQQVFPTQAARSRWLAERGFAAAGKVTPEPSRLHVEPHGAVTVRADSGDGVLARFAAPTSGGPAAALRPDERAVALRAWDGTVRIYELAPFRLVAKVSEPEPTSGLVWHPNGELLLLEGSTPSLRSGADGSLVRSLGDQRALPSWGRRERDRLDLLHGEFSPDGCVLHTYGHGSHWLRDARSGNWLADFDQDGSVGPVAWAHTHAVVALVTEDGDVLLWRSHDGRRLTLHAEELGGELALVAYGDDGLWAGDSRAAGGARFRIGDDLLAGETRALEELPRRQHLPTLAGDFVEGRRLDFP